VLALSQLVKPGGWTQLVEAAQTIGDDDGPAVQGFVALIKDALWWGGHVMGFCGQDEGVG
jgi:hypothetical protein